MAPRPTAEPPPPAGPLVRPRTAPPAPALSARALNRATLARQHLLGRARMPALDLIGHLAGLQAQAPYPPYTGLWTRLEAFRHEELARLLLDRSAVRILLQRGTVHLVTAADCLALRPAVQPVIERMYLPARAVAAVGDVDAIAARARRLLAAGPLTPAELGSALAAGPEGATGATPRQLADAARARLPMVQVPPRAVWGVGGVTRYAVAEDWLGEPLRPMPLTGFVRRYLAAFGPATVADVQAWSGLTRLREVTDGMTDLLRLRGPEGQELLDLPDAPRPDPDVPAPVRFLPAFDNLVLSHADRSRVIRDEYRPRIFSRNGIVAPTVLTGGRVTGSWDADGGTLTVTPFEPYEAATVNELHAEGLRLARFLAPAGATPRVRFAETG